MADTYSINGKGFESVFGVIVTKDAANDRVSEDSFMQWSDRKESLRVDRQDRNGDLIDLSEPKFESREFILTCHLKATDRADFFTKYEAFRTEFYSADTHQLYIQDHNRTYQVYYKKQANFKSLSNINNDGIWCRFEIILGERNPFDNQLPIFLVDDQDRYLIT